MLEIQGHRLTHFFTGFDFLSAFRILIKASIFFMPTACLSLNDAVNAFFPCVMLNSNIVLSISLMGRGAFGTPANLYLRSMVYLISYNMFLCLSLVNPATAIHFHINYTFNNIALHRHSFLFRSAYRCGGFSHNRPGC